EPAHAGLSRIGSRHRAHQCGGGECDHHLAYHDMFLLYAELRDGPPAITGRLGSDRRSPERATLQKTKYLLHHAMLMIGTPHVFPKWRQDEAMFISPGPFVSTPGSDLNAARCAGLRRPARDAPRPSPPSGSRRPPSCGRLSCSL